MKQELQDRLLAAAQAVVADVEPIDEEFCQVDIQIMDDLVKVVKEISDDAVRELTVALRITNAQHYLQTLEKRWEDLGRTHDSLYRLHDGKHMIAACCGCETGKAYQEAGAAVGKARQRMRRLEELVAAFYEERS